jgi:hypothetical protein
MPSSTGYTYTAELCGLSALLSALYLYQYTLNFLQHAVTSVLFIVPSLTLTLFALLFC